MWAAVFPGQGSQSVGMGKLFFENFSLVRELFEESSDALGLNFKKLCFEGPEDALTLTENTQPALLLISTSLYRVFESETGFVPSLGAGHSLGEYSALVASRTLDYVSALKAVRTRGLAMQSACPVGEGGMAAVMGLENEDADKLCNWAEKTSGFAPLRPANFNAPGQIVISGSLKAIEWLKANYDPAASGVEKKLKLIQLNVSAPFHSPLMKPAQEKMGQVLGDIRFEIPKFPIVQNTTAEPTSNIEVMRRELTAQVSAPVKWSQSVIKMRELGAKRFIEFGPGKVLAGLVKKIDSENLSTFNIQTLEDLKVLESQVKA